MNFVSLFSSIRQESPIHHNDAWLITYGDIKSFLHKNPQCPHKNLLISCISRTDKDELCISYEEFVYMISE